MKCVADSLLPYIEIVFNGSNMTIAKESHGHKMCGVYDYKPLTSIVYLVYMT